MTSPSPPSNSEQHPVRRRGEVRRLVAIAVPGEARAIHLQRGEPQLPADSCRDARRNVDIDRGETRVDLDLGKSGRGGQGQLGGARAGPQNDRGRSQLRKIQDVPIRAGLEFERERHVGIQLDVPVEGPAWSPPVGRIDPGWPVAGDRTQRDVHRVAGSTNRYLRVLAKLASQ